MLQAGGVVGELRKELGNRVVRVRGLRSLRFVAVGRGHGVKLLDTMLFVKPLYRIAPSAGFARGGPVKMWITQFIAQMHLAVRRAARLAKAATT